MNSLMKIVAIGAAAVVSAGALMAADSDAAIAREIVAIERRVMDGWQNGDSGPALAVADREITYFHMMTERRLDGVAAVRGLYEPYGGRPLFDSYELLDPKVQVCGEVAVLTYNLVSRNGGMESRWNATQVYQRRKEGWRVIHSHFSQTRPAMQRR